MKKVFFSVLSISIVAGALTSCGKTTKGKMDNEWNVTSITESSYNEDGDGHTTKISETSVVTTTVFGNVSETETTASVNSNTMTISKDGTWKHVYDYTMVEYDTVPIFAQFDTSYVMTTTNIVETTSGTWGFESKNKTEEFKKNERVVFNMNDYSKATNVTAKQHTKLDPSVNTTTTTENETFKYSLGESVTVYVVKESTSKKLVLTADKSSNYSDSETSSGTTTTSTSSSTDKYEMTLEEK